MRPLLEAMPVTLLDDPQLALKGAAVYGARSLPDMHSSQD
jgi:glucokinase